MKKIFFLLLVLIGSFSAGYAQTTIFDNPCNTPSSNFPSGWSIQVKNQNNNNQYYRIKNSVATEYVISKSVDLSSYTNVVLTTRMKSAGNSPICLIEYSTDNGASWNTISSRTPSTSMTDYTDAISTNNSSVKFRWTCSNGNGSTNLVITNLKLEGTLNTPKSVNSITYNQASTSDVDPGSSDNEILRIDIDVTGNTGTLNLNSIKITANNTSDADIASSGVKLYRTTTTTFSTTNQLGSAQSLSGGTATFSGLAYDLPTGTTYIWAVYDIAYTASNSNTVDMKIAAGDINIGGSTYPSAVQDPSGDRTISILTWTGTNGTDWFDGGNWSSGSIPTSSDDVSIPGGLSNYPSTDHASKAGKCKSMFIASGATVNMSANTKSFQVFGDLVVEGTFNHLGLKKMLFKGSTATVRGSGTINSNAKFRVAADNQVFTLERDLYIYKFDLAKNGAALYINGYTLKTDSAFNNSSSYTTDIYITTGTLEIAADTATLFATLHITGNGEVKFTGNSFYVYPGDYENLVIGGSTNKYLYGDLTVNGDISISSGTDLKQNGHNITIKGDWTNDGSLTAGTQTVTFNGSSAQSIGGSTSTTFYNLTVNNSNGLTLNKTTTVSNTLTLTSGIITSTSSNILAFGSSATAVSGAGSSTYVDGPVKKSGSSDFEFPTGDGGRYAPVKISNLSGSADITAEYFASAYSNTSSYNSPLTKVSGKEYWNISPSSSITADVTLNWKDGSWSGIGSLSDLRVAHWNGSAWEEQSAGAGTTTTGNTTSGSISVSNVSSFSPFTFGTIDNTTNPLPIELLSFDAKPNGENVLVSWQTATEQDNDYFIIERSKDGIEIDQLGIIKGAGNSNTILDYDFWDNTPYSGTSYYRLVQVDYNGQSETFDWVAVYRAEIGDAVVNIYPNPVTFNYLNVKVSNMEGPLNIELYDISGRVLYQKTLENINDGTFRLNIDLAHGIYNMRLFNASKSIVKRLIVE